MLFFFLLESDLNQIVSSSSLDDGANAFSMSKKKYDKMPPIDISPIAMTATTMMKMLFNGTLSYRNNWTPRYSKQRRLGRMHTTRKRRVGFFFL